MTMAKGLDTEKASPVKKELERPVIKITNGIPRHPLWRMAEPVSLEINRGEQIAIAGGNAAGKSRLVEILTGHYPLLRNEVHYDFSPSTLPLVSDNLKYISFRDSYGDQDGTYYYQQRWNQHDISDDMPTVARLLGIVNDEPGTDTPPSPALYYSTLLNLRSSFSKRIISLSSGELRKFQMVKVLATNPRVLVLDNPFIGLDAAARRDFRGLLETLTRRTELLVILVFSRRGDIPDFITHVLPVEGMKLLPKMTLAGFRRKYAAATPPKLKDEVRRWIANLPSSPSLTTPAAPCMAREIIRFRDVSISYGGHTILKHVSWTVHEGERWALSGRNGSGKSTLLSLVCADNPQAYACDIELFGHRRGTGESIWEIKRRIGYVSPEMHRAYLKDIPAIDVVASGLCDSVGLYVRPRPEQRQSCLDWMRVFGIEALADRSFLQLSSGEQRLCLLVRAFVKDPELLVLDEPLHGLDDQGGCLVRQIVEQFCLRPHKTLVFVTHYEEELPRGITHRLCLDSTGA